MLGDNLNAGFLDLSGLGLGKIRTPVLDIGFLI